MPNYVTSRCLIVGPPESLARFRSEMIRPAPEDHSDRGGLMLDFEQAIPMPPILREAEASSAAEEGMALIEARGDRGAPFGTLGLYRARIDWIRAEAGLAADAHIGDVAAAFLAKHPKHEQQGLLRMQALIQTGYANWYPWAIAKWGTKWGAFRFGEIDSDEGFAFRFETAWSFPTPVFEALAARYPDLSFNCCTFDEGSCFAGEGWFNPPPGKTPFFLGKATVELYEKVYGMPMPIDDEEEDAA